MANQHKTALRDILSLKSAQTWNRSKISTDVQPSVEMETLPNKKIKTKYNSDIGLFRISLDDYDIRYGVWYTSSMNCDKQIYVAWLSEPIQGQERFGSLLGDLQNATNNKLQLYRLRSNGNNRSFRNVVLRHLIGRNKGTQEALKDILYGCIQDTKTISQDIDLGSYMRILAYLSILGYDGQETDIAKILDESVSIENDVPISEQLEKRLSSLTRDFNGISKISEQPSMEISRQQALDGIVDLLFKPIRQS